MMEKRIPEYLNTHGAFCLWKREERDGRVAKVPHRTDGRRARSDHPEDFCSLERAQQALDAAPGVYDGLGVGVFDDLVAIDIDHCCNNGVLSPLAQEIVTALDSYAERSPSGKGVHVLCRAPGLQYDPKAYRLNNRELGLEIYVGGHTHRFLTLTGDALNECGLECRTDAVAALLDKHMVRKTAGAGAVLPAPPEEDIDPDAAAMDDAEALDRMLRSKNNEKLRQLWGGDWAGAGYPSQSEADLALCSSLAFFCQRDPVQIDRMFRQSALMREKWDQQRGAMTYGEATIQAALRTTLDDAAAGALEFLYEVDFGSSRRYTYDDTGAGFLLADYMKPFARPLGRGRTWIVYDGTRWQEDPAGTRPEQVAKEMGRAILAYAAALPGDANAAKRTLIIKWSMDWGRRNRRTAFLEDAKSVYPVSRSDFDSDPWLLNVQNGTLDLRSMTLRPHSADDLITRLAPVTYDPGATCSRWERFIDEVMAPANEESPGRDRSAVAREKAAFLRAFCGYCLTGDTSEECFLIMYGASSRNGKGVLTSAIQAVLGDYSLTMNPDSLTLASRTRDGRAPSEDIARLNGVRLAVAGEIQQGARLNASLVKQLTGGDRMNARFLGENSFDFQPAAKLMIHTNHLPATSDISVFASGRVNVLTFGRHFEPWEQDPHLKQEFRKPENQSAILNWLLQGLADYKRNSGLRIPETVRSATADYRMDSDKTARFVEDRLTKKDGVRTRLSSLYVAYGAWCRENGNYPESNRAFRRSLEQAGIRIEKARPTGENTTTPCVCGYELDSTYYVA